ncbi:MAG: YicC/YloC family endoribonuclease [Bacteroidales bacterium]|nr:YicC/YloC family endoribonuclease [Bacteroidales bacterium]
MIRSMTGFGRATVETGGKTVTVEIRTLNSKQLDLNTRIPLLFKNFENEIRSILSKEIVRAKADITITVENHAVTSSVSINKDLAKSYFNTITELSEELGNPVASDIFIQVLRMPDVVSTPQEAVSEEMWADVKGAIGEACRQVDEFRISEGRALEADFMKRICCIRDMIEEVIPFEESRIVKIREKFEKSLSELSPKMQYDPNRLEQEIFYYLEKLDITEEKVRLRKHCDYFIETLQDGTDTGKKLGFIAQECGREINTLGSKSNDFDIQQIVVRMKGELEKLKEQLANIL